MKLQKILKAGCKYLTSGDYRFIIHSEMSRYDTMEDEVYLKRKYKAAMGQPLDLKNPKTFNEKLQWIKLYDRNPIYTTMVDKVAVKDYVAGILGSRYIIPTLGVWQDSEDIDFDALPDRFVLKCSHNSGLGMCICQDKSKLDIPKVRRKLKKGLQQDYYLTGREWPYKDVPRRILAEQFMSDGGAELADFKVHCFHGEPKFVLVCQDRFSETGLTEDFFTPEWEHLPVKRPKHPNAAKPIPKPAELEQMLLLAARLAKDIPFVRVDFYIIEHQIYFSELTFFPASGFDHFEPRSWDDTFGSWLKLPK